MMCIRYEPRQLYAIHMAAKQARTRHGTYSMGALETWRAVRPQPSTIHPRTTCMTSEDVDTRLTTNGPNHLKHPAQQLHVCAYSTIYHTHTQITDSTVSAMCCFMLACKKTQPQFFPLSLPHPHGCWKKEQGLLPFSPGACHVDPRIIARGKKGSVQSPNMY